MRSKSSFVSLENPYSAPEVSELGAQTRHLSQKQMPNLKLNLKLKINAHGIKNKLEPNQDDASDHFLSAKRLRPGRYSCSFIRFYIDLP